ncbi:MAG TPA: RidA family protein [Kiloniellaceae bacterium]|nr:RidA family protein [Kiloniellaceae bacterium]
MNIKRFPGGAKGRSAAVSCNGLVYAVATSPQSTESVSEQTRYALAKLDGILAAAGTSKTALVQTTIYLKDMSTKEEMDAVWCEWIGGEENWPQRACVGADLAGSDLVEIVVTALAL